MTEKELIELGFIKEEGVDKEPYYYYVHDVCGLSFITDCSDENEDDFTVEFDVFDTDCQFKKKSHLASLLSLIRAGRVEN